MNNLIESDQAVFLDTLKYTSDIVIALTTKISDQGNEINLLKNKVIDLETHVPQPSQQIIRPNRHRRLHQKLLFIHTILHQLQ
ncbi:MAG: hypothetical protein Gaeavirus33_3 [Gaeavirus sp.]|uniref:Uncharacterized protein n=1 Tax=Gaeavirus sp. TaxID=2487767 RepID=A0A3G4ZZK5_9VIRU|nr:MAG: hypothetical protein Gaeavirus33_3 [Gaeavirus sp.]